MKVLTNKQKGYALINELLLSELGDYSQFQWKILESEFRENTEDIYYFEVDIKNNAIRISDTFEFYFNNMDDIYICLCSNTDHWEMVREYDHNVRHFWILFDLWRI